MFGIPVVVIIQKDDVAVLGELNGVVAQRREAGRAITVLGPARADHDRIEMPRADRSVNTGEPVDEDEMVERSDLLLAVDRLTAGGKVGRTAGDRDDRQQGGPPDSVAYSGVGVPWGALGVDRAL